jgi:hypothetical protein
MFYDQQRKEAIEDRDRPANKNQQGTHNDDMKGILFPTSAI